MIRVGAVLKHLKLIPKSVNYLKHALSPSVDPETAQQERSVLLAGDKRLLREGSDVVLLSNQKGNYETLT
jgi:hypothetical protein